MGREVKRIPANFDWPIGRTWPGAMMGVCGDMEDHIAKDLDSDKRCELCRKWAKLAGLKISTFDCPVLPLHEPPKGKWYQVWETVSEGSPISPAFETPEQLAKWLADNNASASGSGGATYDQWLSFINGPGWAPSGIIKNEKMESGVVAFSESTNRKN